VQKVADLIVTNAAWKTCAKSHVMHFHFAGIASPR